ETAFEVEWTTSPPLPHIVIDEVLANPVGPERTSEWIELANDGTTSVDVAGWTLEDSGGRVALPRAVLDPGALALVVSTEFVASPEDIAPAPGTLIVRVPQLTSAGLANAGERLRLLDPAGVVRSEFPAVPAPRAGVSIE